MQRRIDDPSSSDRIDSIVSYTIDYLAVVSDIIKAQTALGSVTRSQSSLPAHVTKQVSPATQITT